MPKLYHFTKNPSIEIIDPKYFGRDGICNIGRHAQGIEKSFYFNDPNKRLPNPETRPWRYEIDLPEDWEIYDAEEDPQKFREQAKKEPSVYLQEIAFEELVKKAGYKGEIYGGRAKGVIALFYPLLVAKKPELVMSSSNAAISLATTPSSFFAQENKGNSTEKAQTIQTPDLSYPSHPL